MDLVPFMYFEQQEAGSQLCAQHCLNNLLQQFTYSEFDLADIAHKLDHAENAELSLANQNKKSYNLDDTGFFSISVLERALQVWDLTLVRWRGEAMKPYQKHPEDQTAFILNLSSHWFPLRRFSTNPPHSSAVKRWYNLNSFLNQPEWISPTYLGMVLTQAEQEGYSVFVVRKAGKEDANEGGSMAEGAGWGDGGVGILPECAADTMAVEFGEPVGRVGSQTGPSASRSAPLNPDQPSIDPNPPSPPLAGPSSPPKARRGRQNDIIGNLDEDDPFLAPSSSRPLTSRTAQGDDDDDEDIPEHTAFGQSNEFDFQHFQRSYDDEDAALQAALRASMEDVPTDWVLPELNKKKEPAAKERPLPTPAPQERKSTMQKGGFETPQMPPVPKAPAPVTPQKNWKVAGEGRKKEEKIDIPQPETPTSPVEELSQDEIRRRRLAKFGQ